MTDPTLPSAPTTERPSTVAGRTLLMAGLTFGSGRRLADYPGLILAIEAAAVAEAKRGHAECEANMDAEIERLNDLHEEDGRLLSEITEKFRSVEAQLAEANHEAQACNREWGIAQRQMSEQVTRADEAESREAALREALEQVVAEALHHELMAYEPCGSLENARDIAAEALLASPKDADHE